LDYFKQQISQRDAKVQSLHQDKLKLKSLLRKAKDAIASVSEKLATSQAEVLRRTESINELQARLQKISEGPSVHDVKRVMARVKVQDAGYTLLQVQNGNLEWHSDSSILSIQHYYTQEFNNTKQVNYSKVFEEL